MSQLVTAPSQSPGNPLSTGPVYCASAEEPGLSLSSFSTLTSKLINGCLLFSLAGIRGSQNEVTQPPSKPPPPHSALDVKQPRQTRVCDRITPTWDLGFKSDGCVRAPSHMTQSDGIECMALHARFQAQGVKPIADTRTWKRADNLQQRARRIICRGEGRKRARRLCLDLRRASAFNGLAEF